jgi:hypothetical protein
VLRNGYGSWGAVEEASAALPASVHSPNTGRRRASRISSAVLRGDSRINSANRPIRPQWFFAEIMQIAHAP